MHDRSWSHKANQNLKFKDQEHIRNVKFEIKMKKSYSPLLLS